MKNDQIAALSVLLIMLPAWLAGCAWLGRAEIVRLCSIEDCESEGSGGGGGGNRGVAMGSPNASQRWGVILLSAATTIPGEEGAA